MDKILMGATFALMATAATAETTIVPHFNMEQVDQLCGLVSEIAEEVMMQRNAGTPQWIMAMGIQDVINDETEFFEGWKPMKWLIIEIIGDAYRSNETTQVFMMEQFGKCQTVVIENFTIVGD